MDQIKLECPNPQCPAEVYTDHNNCPICGTRLVPYFNRKIRTGTGSPITDISNAADDEFGAEQLDIELQYKHLYLRAGEYGCIPLRLLNRGQEPVTQIHLTVKSAAFHSEKTSVQLDRKILLETDTLAEFGECEGHVADTPGQFPVHLSGYYTVGESTLAFRGRFTLSVSSADEKGPSIIVDDAGALMMDGVDVAAVNNIFVRDGGAADISCLKKGPAGTRGEWISVHLDYDPATTRLLHDFQTSTKDVQTVSVQYSNKKSRAFLRINADGYERSVQILTGNNWKIGRSRTSSDVVADLLPVTEENNQKSERISREHCKLFLHNTNRITVEDLSSNGTSLSGSKVQGPLCLMDGGRLTLAGVMDFYCQEFRDYSQVEEVSSIKNRSQTIMDFSTSLASVNVESLASKAPLNCFTLLRGDEFRDKLSYVFLCRYVRLGSSSVCGIQIEDQTVAPQHAQLIFQEDGFYLFNMGKGATWVNERPVAPRAMCPLPQDAEVNIRLGETEMSFSVTSYG